MDHPTETSEAGLVRLAIGQPIYGHMAPACVLSFCDLVVGAASSEGIGSVELVQVEMAYVDNARNEICSRAIKEDSTHLLFVDMDIVLPRGALLQLLEHDLPVVGGLYFSRAFPFEPVVWDWTGSGGIRRLWGYSPGVLQRVGGIGMGCTLLRTTELVQIAEHYGDQWWFKKQDRVGEDVWFAERCRRRDIPIHLDARVACGHIGSAAVTEEAFRRSLDDAKREGVVCTHAWLVDSPEPCLRCLSDESNRYTSPEDRENVDA